METVSSIETLLKRFIKESVDGNGALLMERARCHDEINKLKHIEGIPREELAFTLDLRVKKVCELLSLAYPHLKGYQSREEYLVAKENLFELEDICRALDHLHSLVDIEDGVGHIQIDCRDRVCLKALRYGANMIKKIISDNESLNDQMQSYTRWAEGELRTANLEIANLRERLRKQKEVADRWEVEVDTVNARLIEDRKMHSDSFYGKVANEVEKVLNDAAIPVCNGSEPMTLAERVQWCIDDNACSHIKQLQETLDNLRHQSGKDAIRLVQERNNALEELHAQSVETEILKRELSELQNKGETVYKDASTLYVAGLNAQAEIERLRNVVTELNDQLEATRQDYAEFKKGAAEYQRNTIIRNDSPRHDPSLLELSVQLYAQRSFDRLLTKQEAIEEALEFIELVKKQQAGQQN